MVHLANRWDRLRKQKEKKMEETINAGDKVSLDMESLEVKASSVSSSGESANEQQEAILKLYGTPTKSNGETSNSNHQKSIPSSSASLTSEMDVKSTGSTRSQVSTSSSFVSAVALSVLDVGRPHVHKKKKHHHQGGRKIAAGGTKSSSIGADGHVIQSETQSVSIEGIGEAHFTETGSIISALDHDEDEATRSSDRVHVVPIVIEEEDDDDVDISLSAQFMEVVQWDDESKRLMSLTIPFSIQGCIRSLFQIVNVAVIGNHVGVMEANAYVVVGFLVEFSGALTYGFGEAIGSLVPQAEGAGNQMLAGRYLQLCQLLYSVLTIPAIVIWSIWMYDAVLWFGFDEETARISQAYAYPFVILMFVTGFDHGIHEFLSTVGHEQYSTAAQTGYYALPCLGVVISVASGVKDLPLIGLVQVALGLFVSLSNIVCVFSLGWMDEYWEGLLGTLSLKVGSRLSLLCCTVLGMVFRLIHSVCSLTGWARYTYHDDHRPSTFDIMASHVWRGKTSLLVFRETRVDRKTRFLNAFAWLVSYIDEIVGNLDFLCEFHRPCRSRGMGYSWSDLGCL